MTRESYLKKLIKENGLTIKDFAKKIHMPYSTLLTMLNEEKIGNASVDNVIKICRGLNITIQNLQNVLEADSDTRVCQVKCVNFFVFLWWPGNPATFSM